jgi:hypothetical protein
VGLNRDGEMLLQTLPGRARTFDSFRPRDELFYLRIFGRLVESALNDGGRHEPALPAPESDAAIAHLVTRLSSRYALRAVQLLIDSHGDIRAGLLAEVIHAANTAHLDARTQEGQRIAGPDGVIPDELRRPINISRLAESSGLPFETTRRIVQTLIDAGSCVRVDGGVIVPGAIVRRPETVRAVKANAAYVRKFVRDLEVAGFCGGAAWPPAAGETDARLGRIVARVSAEYVLRALRLLVDLYGDIRAGVVTQTIVVANTAHLEARDGQGWRYAGINDSLPDESRQPISVARLAESLALPYETMRCQVRRLVDAGVCIRVGKGFVVPKQVLETPQAARASLANVGYVRKFVRDVRMAVAAQTEA